MTESRFIEVCLEHEVDPGIAFECDAVIEALKQSLDNSDDQPVIQAIEDNF